jgi:hypothetical protein
LWKDSLMNATASAEQRLNELGIKLPAPPEPFGTYVEAVQAGNQLPLGTPVELEVIFEVGG